MGGGGGIGEGGPDPHAAGAAVQVGLFLGMTKTMISAKMKKRKPRSHHRAKFRPFELAIFATMSPRSTSAMTSAPNGGQW